MNVYDSFNPIKLNFLEL